MVNLTSLVEFKSLPPLRPQNSPNHIIIYMKTKTKKEKNKIIVKKAKPTSSNI